MVPPLLPVTYTSFADRLPLTASAVLSPMASLSLLSDSLKSVLIFFTAERFAASLRAAASVFRVLILFCSSVFFFLKSSVSVSVTVFTASVPLSPMTAILFTPNAFRATPAPTDALVLELPRARPPTILVTVLSLLAVSTKVPAVFTVVSSSASTRLLMSPVRAFRLPDALIMLSALPALKMMAVCFILLAAFMAISPLSSPAFCAFMDTFLPDRIRLSPEKSCTATLAPTPLPLLSEKAKYSPPLPVALTTLVSVVASTLIFLPALISAFSPIDTMPLLCNVDILKDPATAALFSLESTM